MTWQGSGVGHSSDLASWCHVLAGSVLTFQADSRCMTVLCGGAGVGGGNALWRPTACPCT